MRLPRSLPPAAVLLLALSSGCSWVMVARPPRPPVEPLAPLHCTSETAAPIVDAIMGATGVTTGALAYALGERGGSCPGGSPGAPSARCAWDRRLAVGGLVMMGLGVVAGSSAATGLSRTARCQELTRLQLDCRSGVEPSCDALRKTLSSQPPPRVSRPRAGFDLGEACAADTDCREGLECRLGRCGPIAAP